MWCGLMFEQPNVLKRCIKIGMSFLCGLSFCFFSLTLLFHLFDIYFSVHLYLFLFLVLCLCSPVSVQFLQQISVPLLSFLSFIPFVLSSSTMPHITTPLPPPSPLFLCLLHLIIHHSQIWLNVLSWKGWNSLSPSLSPCLFFSLTLPVCCHGNRI